MLICVACEEAMYTHYTYKLSLSVYHKRDAHDPGDQMKLRVDVYVKEKTPGGN